MSNFGAIVGLGLWDGKNVAINGLGSIEQIVRTTNLDSIDSLKNPPIDWFPAENAHPGRDEIHKWNREWTAQRALVLAEDSINLQFKTLHNQGLIEKRLHYQNGSDVLDATLSPFEVRIPPGGGNAEENKIYILLCFASGTLTVRSTQIKLEDWKLSFGCNVGTTSTPTSGYSTQALLRALSNANESTIDTKYSVYGRAGNEYVSADKWRETEQGHQFRVDIAQFFTNFFDAQKKANLTNFGHVINDKGHSWPPGSGSTRLLVFSPRRSVSANVDWNFLVWLESSWETNGDPGNTTQAMSSSFMKSLWRQLEKNPKGCVYVEKTPIRYRKLAIAVESHHYALQFDVKDMKQMENRQFELIPKPRKGLEWAASWEPDTFDLKSVRTKRAFSRCSEDKMIPVWNVQALLKDKPPLHLRALANFSSAPEVSIHPDANKITVNYTGFAKLLWSYYFNDKPVPSTENVQGFTTKHIPISTTLRGTYERRDDGQYSLDIADQGPQIDYKYHPGWSDDLETRQKVQAGVDAYIKSFKNRTAGPFEHFKDVLKHLRFINSNETTDWLTKAGITLNKEGKDAVSRRTRSVNLVIESVKPSNEIQITVPTLPKVEPPTAQTQPGVQSGLPPPQANTGQKEPMPKPPPVLPSVVEVPGDRLLHLDCFGSKRFVPGIVSTLVVQLKPLPNKVLHLRYVDVHFKSETKHGEFFRRDLRATADELKPLAWQRNSLKESNDKLEQKIKVLKGSGFAVHVTAKTSAGVKGLLVLDPTNYVQVDVAGVPNTTGQYDLGIAVSIVDDNGDALEWTEMYCKLNVDKV